MKYFVWDNEKNEKLIEEHQISFEEKEKEILASVDQDDWRTLPQIHKERHRFQSYAEATFKKDKRINIRISGKDLHAIQKRALEEGIPYQTLISSLLHKYVSGRLIEKKTLTRMRLALLLLMWSTLETTT